ncbi:MAG: histidinol-phosphatase [Alphaproteobacteria bacterium]
MKTLSDDLVTFAETLADTARDVIRPHFRTRLDIVDKQDESPVTIADRDAEEAMRRLIEDAYPDHGIFGEEFGAVRTDADYVWVLDPIDGTKSFVTGLPVFGTLIALAHRGRPVLGVIDQPILSERWIGAAGRPTTLNGAAAKTSGCTDLAAASLYTTHPSMMDTDDRRTRYDRLVEQVKLGRFGGDCYAYGLLASGHVDLVVEANLFPYDYMALVGVVEQAGGVISDWQGKSLDMDSDGAIVAAATPELHRTVLNILG